MRTLRKQQRRAACNCSAFPARWNAGFTLMELLLVLGLLVTVTSMVMPGMARYQRAMPLNQAVAMIQSELTRTRLLAIDSAVTWSVEFNAGGSSFVRRRVFEADSQSVGTFQLPEGVTFQSASVGNPARPIQPLQFYADGTVTNAALVLQDSEGIQRELILDRLTGTIRPMTSL